MLEAVPKGIFSRRITVFAGEREVGTVEMPWVGERGVVRHEGTTYRLSRERAFSGDFFVERDGQRLAFATKPHAFRRELDVRWENKHFVLRAARPFFREFVLEEDGRIVGRVAPKRAFINNCTADLPEAFPVPVQLFLLWLVLLMWKRSSPAATG